MRKKRLQAYVLILSFLLCFVENTFSADTTSDVGTQICFDEEITEIIGGQTYHAALLLRAPSQGEKAYTVLQGVYGCEGTRELMCIRAFRVTVSAGDADETGFYRRDMYFDLSEMAVQKEYSLKGMVWEKGALRPVASEEISSDKLGVDFIKNGSFEMNGHWESTGHTVFSEDVAAEGKKALCFVLSDDSMQSYCVQKVCNIIPGEEHTFSFSLRVEEASLSARAAVKFEVYDKNDAPLQQISFDDFYPTKGKWTVYIRKITPDKNAAYIKLLLRWFGRGTAYYDAVSLKMPTRVFNEKRVIEPLPAPYGEALIENGGFESVKNHRPDGGNWAISHTWGGGIISLTDHAHTGNYAVKIHTSTGGNHFIRYLMPVAPHTEYVLRSFIKPVGIQGMVAYAFEFYTSEMQSAGASYVTPELNGVEKVWNPYTYIFTAPAGASYVAVLTRLYGTGTMYVDDLTAYAIGKPAVMDLQTDEEFYYTEWGGNVKTVGEINLGSFPELENGSARLSLYANNEKRADLGVYSITEGKIEAAFPLAALETLGEEYVIVAEAYTHDGIPVGTAEKAIYRYNRPTLLDEQGYISYGQTPFAPVYFYHGDCTEAGIMAQKAYGANTVIIDADYMTQTDRLESILNICKRENMKAILATYLHMHAGGHPDNIENTRNAVSRIWQHEALLGYMAADEPYTTIGKTYAEDLHATYRAIRDLDPIHPVIVNEASPSAFGIVSKRCDIISHDPYIGENAAVNSPATFVAQRMRQLKAAAGKKPTIAVLQAFRWGMNNGEHGIYTPTADEIRHMAYQSLLEDAIGVAFYSFTDADKDMHGNISLPETIWGAGVQKFNTEELPNVIEYFVFEKYPAFCSYDSEVYVCRAFVKDGEIYMLLLNRDGAMTPQAGYAVSVPLISSDGSVSVGAYTAEILAGGSNPVCAGAGTLSHQLQWRQAVLYKITPENPIHIPSP